MTYVYILRSIGYPDRSLRELRLGKPASRTRNRYALRPAKRAKAAAPEPAGRRRAGHSSALSSSSWPGLARLGPAIHVSVQACCKTWMPGPPPLTPAILDYRAPLAYGSALPGA